jgi:hypothetical protein
MIAAISQIVLMLDLTSSWIGRSSTACATSRTPALQLGLQGRRADAVMQITLRGQMPQCNLPKAFFDAESVRPVFDRRKERRRIHKTVSDRAAY